MNIVLQPWQLAFAILSGWVHQRQQQIIEFQNSEILSLMQSQGKKRMLLTDDQRRLLAVKGKALGRKTLRELTTIVTPDTILASCTSADFFYPTGRVVTAKRANHVWNIDPCGKKSQPKCN